MTTADKQLFTLDVFITEGEMSDEFCDANPEISRTIEIRGDQTLAQLHDIIFKAFDREDEQMYEFQVGGEGPEDEAAQRFVMPAMLGDAKGLKNVLTATLGGLGLEEGQPFGYWFDFGDNWWHQINVVSIGDVLPAEKLPRITGSTGASPPQYMDEE
jgi:hypothetical protein